MQEYETIFPQVQKKVASFLGDQVSLSYPMPDVTKGVRVERFFLYPAGNTLNRQRPFGLLTTAMENGRILEYRDCHIHDFMDTARYPFTHTISYELPKEISVRQYKTEQGLINKLYETVRTIAFQETLYGRQKEVLTKYWVLLLRSVPEALHPYYQKMGKNFYRWGYLHVGKSEKRNE